MIWYSLRFLRLAVHRIISPEFFFCFASSNKIKSTELREVAYVEFYVRNIVLWVLRRVRACLYPCLLSEAEAMSEVGA